MITRFYVDNYKCLQNFEYKPKPLELIIGANGSGKSTMMEALRNLQEFIVGDKKAEELFTPNTLTRWQQKSIQKFELQVSAGNGTFEYTLEVMHSGNQSAQVHFEELTFNDAYISSFGRKLRGEDTEEGTVSYWEGELWVRENLGIEEMVWSGNNRTILSSFQKRDTPLAHIFKQCIADARFVKLNPTQISSYSNSEILRPNIELSNFASWYRHLVQEKPGATFKLFGALHKTIEGFEEIKFETTGSISRELKVLVKVGQNNGKANIEKFDFEELSDGQRALIVLYTLVFCALDDNTTIIIDEPENYIALAELQPLIVTMEERIAEQGGQILLISHHPEFINMLTEQGKCVRFYRENNGHTRIAEFHPESELTAAEIVARGWEDDEQ